ncbi:MAG: tRNA uridine-5-carboxymethylaminomethyl(34) synthesis GTPase MnmE [Alistipes sp. 58_9_plus]|nr:MAG: tRNA uridine-5-carboxymethylaminomethyl(34) synthesis GTPase MnmE [Alistipes sp. 58_9_plus]
MTLLDNDTIAAPATAAGGALCVVRVSGPRAIDICDTIFRGRTTLAAAKTASAHYGSIADTTAGVIDEAIVTIFRAPHSYTGEDSVEISVHGSSYVVRALMQALERAGARPARAGEFTRRAFLAGRMDLAQAEAVADMIASSSRAAHAVAATQMRGAYSHELQELRRQLLDITSLLELELDFSEEDVEFADRTQLDTLLRRTHDKVAALARSFALGNALKEGVAVAIVGSPNVGKSTLLNRLAGEERAMVSDIAGTTRDTVEARINIDGVDYRFIDTAGVHQTDDKLELMGIDRTRQALEKARMVLWITTADEPGSNVGSKIRSNVGSNIGSNAGNPSGHNAHNVPDTEAALKAEFAAATGIELTSEQILYLIINKIDLQPHTESASAVTAEGAEDRYTIRLSAKTGEGIRALVAALARSVDATAAYRGEAIVTNQRHYHALCEALTALDAALDGLQHGLTSELLSEDIRAAINHLGEITGEITSDDILQNIFSKFCIGK